MISAEIRNLVGGEPVPAAGGAWLDKLRPADGTLRCRLARSGSEDVAAAVWREAGVEALDVYSDWKYVNLVADPALT